MLSFSSILFTALVLCYAQFTFAADIPYFTLNNTARSDLKMPAVGLGLGAYAFNDAVGYGGWPECLKDSNGCGPYTVRAVREWIALGGRRLDTANTYGNDRSIGEAIRGSRVDRKELFILSKVGPGQFDLPLGYADTLAQFEQVLRDLGTSYVDLLLIHWPTQTITQSQDPFCRTGHPLQNDTRCRLSTWRAMLEIYNSGRALAVGVSNWSIQQLQEMINAKVPLPAYNQCPFNLYTSSIQQELRDFCTKNNIKFGGYSPLGVPDWKAYPSNSGMSTTQLEDPRVAKIAAAHNKTAAQVLLQWQYALGIPTNPRSQNAKHMQQNLDSYSFTLTSDDMNALMAAPQDKCSFDSSWYECMNSTSSASSSVKHAHSRHAKLSF